MIRKISEIFILLFPLTNLYSQFSSNILHLSTNTDLIIMSSTDIGKVGIANEYPEALLDVNGSVKIRDKLDLTQHKISNVGKIQFSNLIETFEHDSGWNTNFGCASYGFGGAYPAGCSLLSKLSTQDNQYGVCYSSPTSTLSLDLGNLTYSQNISTTNLKIVGIKMTLTGYANNNVSLKGCKINFNRGNCGILHHYSEDKCANNPITIGSSTQTIVLGSENDNWGISGSESDFSNGFILGPEIIVDYLSPNTSFYIDNLNLRIYYVYENQWNLKQNSTGYFEINFATKNIVSISTTGIFNVNGAYYLNGQPFSGGGAGDNLGNHTATMTLTANYGINASSINITGTGVSGSNPLLSIAGSTMVVLNNGNVGIGTTSPGYKLDVNGDTRISGQAIITGTATVQGNAFSVGGSTFVVNAGSIGISTTQTNGYGLFVNTTTKINSNLDVSSIIKSTSSIIGSDIVSGLVPNLGAFLSIGSSDKDSVFAIGHSTSNQFYIYWDTYTASGARAILATLNGNNNVEIWGKDIILSPATNELMRLTSSGNVGIGKPNPSYKLDVVGDINITGNYRINGNPAGLGDAVLSATQTWTGINTYQGNSIFNSSITINVNPNQQYALTIDTNSNPSDGYLVYVDTNGITNFKKQHTTFYYAQNSNAYSSRGGIVCTNTTVTFNDVGYYKIDFGSTYGNASNNTITHVIIQKNGSTIYDLRCRTYFGENNENHFCGFSFIDNVSGNTTYTICINPEGSTAYSYKRYLIVQKM